MQVEDHSCIVFSDLFLIICVGQEHEQGSLNAEGRLNDIRNVRFFALFLVYELLTGELGVL